MQYPKGYLIAVGGAEDKGSEIERERQNSLDFFKEGIKRLKTAYEKDLSVAIMCSESDPAMCHRYRLITPVLIGDGIDVTHIDQNGRLRKDI